MAGKFTAKGSGNSFFVYRDGDQFLGPFGNLESAETAADREYRRSLKRDRACIACGETFESEGPHNRMCDTCRETVSDCGMVA